jgi:hypothetical protein
VKASLCNAIGIDLYDCNIEDWVGNRNGKILIILSLLEKGPHRYVAIINPSGSVAFDFCDDYLANKNWIDDFKDRNGWYIE